MILYSTSGKMLIEDFAKKFGVPSNKVKTRIMNEKQKYRRVQKEISKEMGIDIL